MAEQHIHINQHSHSDKEIRNKQRISYKLQVTHQRRNMRNQAVQHQPGQEGSQDSLHTNQLHQSGSQEDHGHHKDILHHLVTVTTEEPASDAREGQHNHHAQYHDFQHQPHPEHIRSITLVHTRNNGQNQQGQRIRHRRTSYRNADSPLPVDTVTNHNRIGYQSVRGIHTGQQHRSNQSVPQQVQVGPHTNTQREDKGQQAQYRSFHTDTLEIFHVHFQSGQEHDIIQPHLTEKLKAAVARQNIESMFPDNDTGQNHSDDVRNTQTFQDNRSKQDNYQHQKKDPRRISDGKIYIEMNQI